MKPYLVSYVIADNSAFTTEQILSEVVFVNEDIDDAYKFVQEVKYQIKPFDGELASIRIIVK